MKKRKNKYKWIECVGADVKIYPCEHEKADYKAVEILQKKTQDILEQRDKDVEELQVRLGECIEQLVLNNKYHEERLARYAKLYVGYKRKYKGLLKMRETYERMDEENPFTEEEKEAAKEFGEFKQKAVKLESGKVIHKFNFKKKPTKH